jgi:predicted Rossmann fold flavoprotein
MLKIAIIGGGAAGCFAAANIDTGAEVVVFEKGIRLMQKVLVSGGGRCNVTNGEEVIDEFAANYPRGRHLVRKALYEFGPAQTRAWFTQREVTLKTEADGRIFPVTNDSHTIVDCIKNEMLLRKVEVRYRKALQRITPVGAQYLLDFEDGTDYTADKVLIAIGGLPKLVSYRMFEALGLAVEEPVPSLFTFNIAHEELRGLMGVSVQEAQVRIQGTKLLMQGPVLVTHWGLSGPAVLRLSAIAARELAELEYKFTVLVNWTGSNTEAEVQAALTELRLHHGRQQVRIRALYGLSRRLWEYLVLRAGIANELRWADMTAAAQRKLMEVLMRDAYEVNGKTNYKDEFVTCGGISLKEVEAGTMQCRKHPGLYFAGEVMDVDGVTGGFNFQHAWSSGYLAARHITQSIETWRGI